MDRVNWNKQDWIDIKKANNGFVVTVIEYTQGNPVEEQYIFQTLTDLAEFLGFEYKGKPELAGDDRGFTSSTVKSDSPWGTFYEHDKSKLSDKDEYNLTQR